MVGGTVLVQLGRVDVAADDDPPADLALPQVGVAELGADHQQRVAVGGGLLQRAQPDRRADRQRVRLVDRALAVDGGGDRCAERLGERGQLGLRVDGPATGDDQRPVGRGEQFARRDVRASWSGAGAATGVPTRGSPVQACSSTSTGISMCTGRGRRPVKLPNASVTAEAASSALRHPAAPCHQLIHCAADVLGLVQLAEVAAFGAGGHAGRQQQHRLGLARMRWRPPSSRWSGRVRWW